jgi:group I intron endonuclease
MIGIYKITNPNGKTYVGQSINIEKRKKSYFSMHKRNNQQIILHRSFLKYGVENHKFEVIEECTFDLLNERERYWQDFYNVLEDGLNCRLTKTSDKSGKLSQKTIEKLKAKVCSEETKLKISLKTKGKQLGNENPFFGKKHSEEAKLKISLANKGKVPHNKFKKHSEETKSKISSLALNNKNCLGRVLSEDTKNKISSSLCRKVINIKTLDIYNSYKELALLLNISHNTLNKKLNGSMNNNTDYKYL